MFLKLTPGFNFINMRIHPHVDPKSAKKTFKSSVMLLGSAHAKTVRKTLVKLSPGILKAKDTGRAVAGLWRERRLPRAPFYREQKNWQIFNSKSQKLA